jgi:hypothetical protein
MRWNVMAACCLLGTGFWACTINAQTTKPAYQESEAGLRKFFQDILEASAAKDADKLLALTKSLLLTEAEADKWFADTFGDKLGTKLAADYKKDHKDFGPSLAGLFYNLKEPKQLKIEISCVQSLDDPKSKPLQKIAISAMREPAPLYTASITKEGTGAHITLWSLAYIDGRFRLVGKMRGVKDADDKSPD